MTLTFTEMSNTCGFQQAQKYACIWQAGAAAAELGASTKTPLPAQTGGSGSSNDGQKHVIVVDLCGREGRGKASSSGDAQPPQQQQPALLLPPAASAVQPEASAQTERALPSVDGTPVPVNSATHPAEYKAFLRQCGNRRKFPIALAGEYDKNKAGRGTTELSCWSWNLFGCSLNYNGMHSNV